jgi:predicted nucleic acid-binding protein
MHVFIDSNILLYFTLGTTDEINALQPVFSDATLDIHISTQVVNEFCNVALKKKMRSVRQIEELVQMFEQTYLIEAISPATTLSALKIQQKHKLGFYDSLIIASAVECGCKILYSQDMHHGLLIEKKTKLLNPFK